jgi:fucose permease
MVFGNIIYTIGSILVAAATTVRSFNFMIGGRVILALGDIATQIAQYKMFSSWFAPSNGFASTLGFELAIGKVCAHFKMSLSSGLLSWVCRLAGSWASRRRMLLPR